MSDTPTQYGIPLSKCKDAIITIQRGVTEDDIERIKSWIDLSEDVLTEDETMKPTYLQPRNKS